MKNIVFEEDALRRLKEDEKRSFFSSLVVGQEIDDKVFVFICPKTPEIKEKEGGNTSAESQFLNLNHQLIQNHAKQVKRMLIGGMKLLGLLFFCQQSVVFSRDNLSTLQKLLKSSLITSDGQYESSGLVFSLCPQSEKLICRAYDVNDRSFNSSAVDVKIQNQIWKRVKCIETHLHIDHTIQIGKSEKTENSKDLIFNLTGQFSEFSRMLNESLITLKIDEILDSNALISEIFRDNEASKKCTFHLPLSQVPKQKKKEKRSNFKGEDIQCSLNFSGLIHCMGLVQSNMQFAQAKQILIEDILNSLKTRVELLLEDLETQDTKEGLKMLESNSESLPKRHFYPYLGSIRFSDYSFPYEDPNEMKERFSMFLGLTPNMESDHSIETFTEKPIPEKTIEKIPIEAKKSKELAKKDSSYNALILGLIVLLFLYYSLVYLL